MERLIIVKDKVEAEKLRLRNSVITQEAWNTTTDNSPSKIVVPRTPYLYASKELVVTEPYCKKWCAAPFDTKAPLLTGKAGIGKTHTLWAMKRAIIDAGKEKKFMNWTGVKVLGDEVYITIKSAAEILHHLRIGIGNNTSHEVLKDYQEDHILMIDDFGSEKITDWVWEQMFLILDYRLVGGWPTVISTNLSMKEVAGNYGERIASRLFEMCHKVEMTGEDRRIK